MTLCVVLFTQILRFSNCGGETIYEPKIEFTTGTKKPKNTHAKPKKNLKKIFPNREQFPKELTTRKELSTRKSDKIPNSKNSTVKSRIHPSSKTSVEMSEMKEDDGDEIDVGASKKLNIRRFASTTEHSYDVPKYKCKTPMRLIGVQNDSPISFSISGTKFAFVLGNHSVVVLKWDSAKFVIHRTLEGHTSKVYMLDFSNGSENLLMSGGDDGMFLWDVEKGVQVSNVKIGKDKESHNDMIECGCWTHEGETFVTGSRDNDLKAWDVELKDGQLKCLETIFGHKAAVLDVRFCGKNELLASCGRDSVIKIWSAKTLSRAYRAKRADDSGIKCLLLGTYRRVHTLKLFFVFAQTIEHVTRYHVWSSRRCHDIVLRSLGKVSLERSKR